MTRGFDCGIPEADDVTVSAKDASIRGVVRVDAPSPFRPHAGWLRFVERTRTASGASIESRGQSVA